MFFRDVEGLLVVVVVEEADELKKRDLRRVERVEKKPGVEEWAS